VMDGCPLLHRTSDLAQLAGSSVGMGTSASVDARLLRRLDCAESHLKRLEWVCARQVDRRRVLHAGGEAREYPHRADCVGLSDSCPGPQNGQRPVRVFAAPVNRAFCSHCHPPGGLTLLAHVVGSAPAQSGAVARHPCVSAGYGALLRSAALAGQVKDDHCNRVDRRCLGIGNQNPDHSRQVQQGIPIGMVASQAAGFIG
jgi:hypothetical protein